MVSSATDQQLTNEQASAALAEVADLLEAQGANPFRVRAYRGAAGTVRELKAPVGQVLKAEGVAGLMQLPGIGRSLAHAIDHLVRSGRFPLLERLRGDDVPERAFATVPDIGPGLARRIHQELGIETLSELEAAANDGRLSQVAGMGPKRIRAVRESLAGRFRRHGSRQQTFEPFEVNRDVPVAELLELDKQYRLLDKQRKLPRIAPRRFNPTREAWLSVWHPVANAGHFTVLYSNTERAHEMGTTHDWVVIYRDDDNDHGRWTVITANYGRLRGRRIVRGREDECAEYYNNSSTPTANAP